MADKVKRPHPRVQLEFKLPSRTRQSETAATDLNAIVARHRKAGMPFPDDKPYGDVTNMPKDRLEALGQIQAAREAFESLPFKVRQAVNHDPRRLEEWLVNNPELARSYGMLRPKVDPSSPPENQSSSGTDEGKKKRKASPEADDAAV